MVRPDSEAIQALSFYLWFASCNNCCAYSSVAGGERRSRPDPRWRDWARRAHSRCLWAEPRDCRALVSGSRG